MGNISIQRQYSRSPLFECTDLHRYTATATARTKIAQRRSSTTCSCIEAAVATNNPRTLLLLIPVAALAAVAVALSMRGQARFPAAPKLVVYCAHDELYAAEVLREFERQTGISVAVRYDTEATKSLGFVNQLILERDRPRCDVFWNNELLGTLDLAEKQVLQPYKGP